MSKMRKLIYLTLTLILTGGFILNAQNKIESDISESTGPGSFKIHADTNLPVRIPFVMHNGKPLLDLEINGKKANLMIDNGVLWDQVWLFGSKLVEELKLKPIDEGSIGGAGEGDPTQAYTSDNLTLKFEDITFYEQPVLVSPPASGFAGMFPGTDGQLCNTFFKHFIVEFDFIKNEVILHDPNQFAFTGEGSELDIHENDTGTHSIPFTFTMLDGKTYSNKIDIDFGGVYPIKIALNSKYNINLPEDAKETHSYGAQGKSTEFSGKIGSMTIGKYQFDDLTAIFGDKNTSRIHPENLGVIGLPLFMKFYITFDYINYKLYLEPNKNINIPFK